MQAVREQDANAADVLRSFVASPSPEAVPTVLARVAEDHAGAFDYAQAWLAHRMEARSREFQVDPEERSREFQLDPEERSRELRAESYRRYNASEQGHARHATYTATPGGGRSP